MSFHSKSLATALLAWSLVEASTVVGEQVQDVIFASPEVYGRSTTKNFSYNGRAIGEGRDGFAAIVERISKLPA